MDQRPRRLRDFVRGPQIRNVSAEKLRVVEDAAEQIGAVDDLAVTAALLLFGFEFKSSDHGWPLGFLRHAEEAPALEPIAEPCAPHPKQW